MRDSNYMLDSVYLLDYKYRKMNFKCGRSYTDSLDWVRK